jgi:hypothetical protein
MVQSRRYEMSQSRKNVTSNDTLTTNSRGINPPERFLDRPLRGYYLLLLESKDFCQLTISVLTLLFALEKQGIFLSIESRLMCMHLSINCQIS